ncbi:alcohol dehydrogenase family protein [Candidatus Poriferisodalis multihospitum]|uniref:alcohol dehydrogenase family protein n=1 Tax=Candidatus Poriferisodalis multihospitum TaxID=2983191 RepID=UPI002B25CE98|nr:alcohol dehydrogenase family protein [Candidatus Poriferisodalis multihospitum]
MNPPNTMRAALLVGHGGPEMLQVRDDVPVPVAGPDEVLIEVAACGINNTDINTRVAWYSKSVTAATSGEGYSDADAADSTWGGRGVEFPRIQGADVVGRVVAAGERADTALVGRRVMVEPWLKDPADPTDRSKVRYLGSEADGGFAEYVTVPAVNVYPVESDLSDAELATFACASSTAEHMLQRIGLGAGQSIAVPGASGGVGSALVQLAHRRGARVVAVAGASKVAQVLELGADVVVPRQGPEHDVAAAVEANGGPFDAVADVVGGDAVAPWLDALAGCGRYVTSGAIAGPMVELDLRTLYLNDLELYGATIYGPGLFADLVGYIERGEIRPVLGGTYPLEAIREAQEAFVRKEHFGNLVITL